jgi:hypothetical protein
LNSIFSYGYIIYLTAKTVKIIIDDNDNRRGENHSTNQKIILLAKSERM